MNDSLKNAQGFFEEEEYMSALSILDYLCAEDNRLLILRALCRELVWDLGNALKDLDKVKLDDFRLGWLCRARILAKLGYVDDANHLIHQNRDAEVPKDEQGIPWSYGIVYQYYDLERTGFRHVEGIPKLIKGIENSVERNGLIYGLELAGYFDELIKNHPDPVSIDQWKSFDSMPSGRALHTKANTMKESLQGIRGWMSPIEAATLQFFASKAGRPVIEVGSFCGRSTLSIASAINANNVVYAIDPHLGIEAYNSNDSFSQLQRNLSAFNLSEIVKIVRSTSVEAFQYWSFDKSDLIFIDALHDYENVKEDFEMWSKVLIDGGVILFHDAVQSGVNRLLRESIQREGWKPLGLRDSIFALQKTNEPVLPATIEHFDKILLEKNRDYLNWEERDKLIGKYLFRIMLSQIHM